MMFLDRKRAFYTDFYYLVTNISIQCNFTSIIYANLCRTMYFKLHLKFS